MTAVLFVGKGNNLYTVKPQELFPPVWHMIRVATYCVKISDNIFDMQNYHILHIYMRVLILIKVDIHLH